MSIFQIDFKLKYTSFLGKVWEFVKKNGFSAIEKPLKAYKIRNLNAKSASNSSPFH